MTSVLILLSGFDPGTYVIEDDGDPTNGVAQMRGPDGNVISFNIPTEFLTITASAGRSVVFNLTESFGAADITVGSLTNAADNPDSVQIANIRGAGDVVLAANGSISEFGSDAPADIVASTLVLSAGTGVGAPGSALETQVGVLEAETSTGGINLTNIGAVTIGGLSTDVNGLEVTTSGDILITNAGTITLNDNSGLESVRGGSASGNVTLIANGNGADITSIIGADAISAPGGNITLTAGRDVSLGTQGLSFDNDVRARGDLIINAGRDLNIDGFTDFASDGFGAATGGDVIVNAGRDINVLNATGTDGSIGAEGSAGGNVLLNTGPGGFLRLLADSTSTLFSSTGEVTVNADRVVISATAGITANNGAVTLRPVTPGWAVDLGSVTDGAFALELSDAEADLILTPTLTIGSASAGIVTGSAAFGPANVQNVQVIGGTDIMLTSAMSVTNTLTLRAGDNVHFLPASATTVGALQIHVDQAGDDGNTGGTNTFAGALTAGSIAVTGNVDADSLFGGGSADVLQGLAGNDTLDGGAGADTMTGSSGNDTYFVDNVGDNVFEPGPTDGANDRVFSSVSYSLGGRFIELLTLTGGGNINGTGNSLSQTIIGNSGNNVLSGLESADILQGMDGDDTLDGGAGADTMTGSIGDDTYFVDDAGDNVVEPGAGDGVNDRVFSSVSYSLGGRHIELLTLIGTGNINGTGNGLAQTIIGNSGNNILLGNDGIDVLTGNGGDDTLDGGTGADTMTGNAGNDTYVVDNAGDIVFEPGPTDGVNDQLFSSVSYSLGGRFIEVMTLTGAGNINGTGNSLSQTIVGNSGNNVLLGLESADILQGNGGDDTLDGGTGADTMTGNAGNDTYMVDDAGDNVFEPGAGDGVNDRVFSSVSYSLGGRFIEVMTLTGGGNIDGTGNSLSQTIVGNSGNNVLSGLESADVLTGNGGDDTLDGGTGADTMTGNAGNDIYMVDDVGDSVIEPGAGDGANDQVFSSVSYSLGGRHIEVMTLTGGGNINGTGNGLAQTIIGNSGNNVLSGNDGVDVLTGNGGDDTLDGGTGADTMTGNAGDDVYFVDNVGDNVFEPGAGDGTNDRVFSSVTYSLGGRFIEVMTLTGGGNIDGTGNSLGQTIIGNSGNNVLDGLNGNDVLEGGAGSDTFRFTASPGPSNVDLITDYSVANDTIELENAVFTGLAAGVLAAGAFNTGAAATQADDRIVYNPATGALLFDPDGNGAAVAVQFATISTGLAMTAGEFLVI